MSDVTKRRCGECSLCCTVLRVDELAKLAGTPCVHLRLDGIGCAIHPQRPRICRAYRCLWLGGGLREEDRPDRLGAVLDVGTQGGMPRLEIREASPGAYERSARLREIAAVFRESMPVRITDTADVANPDRPFRVLLAGGEENRVEGERVTLLRHGAVVGERRLGWLQRAVRNAVHRVRARRLARLSRRAPHASPTR